MGKARSLYPEYIYTNKPRYDRDLKNTDGGKSQARLLISSKNLGTK
jgi:hypothetical protein